jgi:TetR/AcrR family transcriptional regulator
VQPRSEAVRQRIIGVAAQEFAQKGFAGAATREIARKAGVSDALIHYHFGRKEGLWEAVARSLYDQMHEENDRRVPFSGATDELGEMRARMRDHMRYLLAHPEFRNFQAHELKARSPRLRYLIETFHSERFEMAIRGIRKAQAAGLLPSGDPNLAFSVIMTLAGALLDRAGEIEELTGRSVRDTDLQDEYWRFIDGLLFGRLATNQLDIVTGAAPSVRRRK